MPLTALQIEASPRKGESITRKYSHKVLDQLSVDTVITRDLTTPLPFLDEDWVNANFTPADQRSDAQNDKLALSDSLIAEVKAADVLVIGVPVYNFGLPASLKAWIDQIARAGVTFRYTENGPEGLLTGKRAVIVVASGGTPVGSDFDFATGYLRHILGFVGITDVSIVAADRLAVDADASIHRIETEIAALAA